MPQGADGIGSASTDPPRPDPLGTFFRVDEVRHDDGRVRYVGESYVPERTLLRKLVPAFRDAGYEVELEHRPDGHVVVATPSTHGRDGVPWTNIALFFATVLSTLFVGAYGAAAAAVGGWAVPTATAALACALPMLEGIVRNPPGSR